jgi:hypothetical protein
MSHRNLWLFASIGLLAACASNSQRNTSGDYARYAGPPIDSFTYMGGISGWNLVDRDHLVVWTGVNDAYLLTVDQPCGDLAFTQRIGLSSTTHSVTRGFDSVILQRDRCRISEIRRVDYAQMKADQRAAAAHP